MRILHVIPSIADAHGGPSRAVASMAEALGANRVQVTVLTTDDAGPGKRMSQGDQIEHRSRFAKRGVDLVLASKTTEFYKVSLNLARWLWRQVGHYDVVHVHALFSFSSVAAALAAGRHGVPYVVRPLGVLGRYGMTSRRPWLKRLSFAVIERPILRRAAAVHCTSAAERAEVKGLVPAASTKVIPIGVEPHEPADPAGLLREIAAPEGRPRLLFLSRLDPKKNLEGLLRAQALLLQRGAPAPFLMIAGAGEPGYVETLHRLAVELGVGDSIAWLGPVDGPRKAAAWAAADLFVLASHEENFGIAAAEAMLAGLPCVLGEGVALAPDAAAAGSAVLTSVEPNDIAVCIAGLLEDPAEARAIGLRAREYAAAQFSTEVMAERLEALYERIAEHRGAGPDVERPAA